LIPAGRNDEKTTSEEVAAMAVKLSPADRKRLVEMVEAIKKLRQEIGKFRGFEDPGYLQHRERVEKALNRVLELERKYLSDSVHQECLYPLRYGYGDIAEAFLQLKDLKRALLYACAYLKINEIFEDTEGIRAAHLVLADVSIVARDLKAFKYHWKKAGKEEDGDYEEILASFKGKKKKMTVGCRRGEPKSFDKAASNCIAYVLAKHLGVSPKEARRLAGQ